MALPCHCLFHFFKKSLLLIPKMELTEGAKGPWSVSADVPLSFCKYLLTSLNSVASVAKCQPTYMFSLFPTVYHRGALDQTSVHLDAGLVQCASDKL